MIKTYSDYIEKYIINAEPVPGEHHFVALYLIPLLYKLFKCVPDYANPDGTKGIPGDVVFNSFKRNLKIEVKFDKIRLTKNEYNNWIKDYRSDKCPNIFIGISQAGNSILPWWKFRNFYIEIADLKDKPLELNLESREYGPIRSINKFIARNQRKFGFYKFAKSNSDRKTNEQEFISALKKHCKKLL